MVQTKGISRDCNLFHGFIAVKGTTDDLIVGEFLQKKQHDILFCGGRLRLGLAYRGGADFIFVLGPV